MTDIQVPQGRIVTVLRRTAEDVKSPQVRVVTIINFPAEEVQTTQARFVVPVRQTAGLRVTQARNIVVGRGRIDNRVIRSWGFSQDGHDFYVLRLGSLETLVYDATTGQWAQWDGAQKPYWQAHLGMNWIGMSGENFFGGATTQVVAGDDSFGILWTLDPDRGYDDPADPGVLTPNQIVRQVVGGISYRGRHRSRSNAVWLTISTGEPTFVDAGVSLRTSDDQGKTWIDHATIQIVPGQYTQEIQWRSLGIMKAPGRIFEFTDNGAMIRIDGADIDLTGDDQ